MEGDFSFEKLSNKCKDFFNKCMSEDNITDFTRGCWKAWYETCVEDEDDVNSRSSRLAPLALIIPIVVLGALSFGANSLICVVFCAYRQLRLVKHYFVINLAAADIIIAVISIPLFVDFMFTNENIVLYRSYIILDMICGTASTLTLAAISLERYCAVVYPLHYNSRVTHARAMAVLAFTWFYAILVSCSTLLSLVTPNKNSEDTLFFGPEFVTFVALASFIIPLTTMIVSYWKIFRVARYHARQIASFQPRVQLDLGSEPRQGNSRMRFKRELKGAKTLTIIIGTHILCWSPFFIQLLVWSYSSCCRGHSMQILNYVSLFLRYCNTLANPIIYCGINRQFRSATVRFILRRRNMEALDLTGFTHSAQPMN